MNRKTERLRNEAIQAISSLFSDVNADERDQIEAMITIGHRTFLHVGHADDVLERRRFEYYVLGSPTMSDRDYDMLERAVAQAFPNSYVARTVGSSVLSDYPRYIREGRRPTYEERQQRDKERYGIDTTTLDRLVYSLNLALTHPPS